MISGESKHWPGRATDPAFSLSGKPYDGGLLRRWRFTLTRADALAWLRLTHPFPRRATGLACLVIGAAVALLPPGLTGPWGSPRFLAFLLAPVLALLLATWAWREWRLASLSRAVLPVPRPGLFEDWGDSLALTPVDDTEETFLALDRITGLAMTRRHLVILSALGPHLVPLSAFAPGEALTVRQDIGRRIPLDAQARHP